MLKFLGAYGLLLVISLSSAWAQSALFTITKGKIAFTSDAPLELIQASSDELKGLMDVEENNFAFSVKTQTFLGFNSALQREHFNENYMESARFPACTFSGKIIEDIDFSRDGTYTVRAKGKLDVHGISKERIIKSRLIIEGEQIRITSEFTVLLQEHDIAIPKIVHQKIAEEIQLKVDALFSKKTDQ